VPLILSRRLGYALERDRQAGRESGTGILAGDLASLREEANNHGLRQGSSSN